MYSQPIIKHARIKALLQAEHLMITHSLQRWFKSEEYKYRTS